MDGTTPAKYKFFICLQVSSQSAVGIVINFRINELGQGEALRPCHAPVEQGEHPFLSHDSWANCTRTFTVPGDALNDRRGTLSPEAVRAVLGLCPVRGQ